MASDHTDPHVNGDGEEADAATIAKLYQDLAKGERQATALENQLTVMEAKINELLAKAESDQAETRRAQEQTINGSSSARQEKPEGQS